MTLDRLRPVPPGNFHRWIKDKFDSQNTVPRLTNHREFEEEVLQFAQE